MGRRRHQIDIDSALPVIVVMACSIAAMTLLAAAIANIPGMSWIEGAIGVLGFTALVTLLRLSLEE